MVVFSILSGVIAVVGGPSQKALLAFGFSLPLMVFSGGTLLRRVWAQGRGGIAAPWLLAAALLIPAVGVRVWLDLLALDDVTYRRPDTITYGILQLGARGGLPVASLVLGVAVGLVGLTGRRGAAPTGMLLGAAAGAAGAEAALRASYALLAHGEPERAAWFLVGAGPPVWTVGATVLGWLIGLVIGGYGHRLVVFGGGLFAVALGTLMAPPVLPLVAKVSFPTTDVPVPVTTLGRTAEGQAIAPAAEDASAALKARGGYLQRDELDWPCPRGSTANWAERVRALAPVALPADADITAFEDATVLLRRWSMQTLALVGRAEVDFPLADGLLGWPTALFLLDRPPAGLRWVRIARDGSHFYGPAPSQGANIICGLWIDRDVDIQTLYDQARALTEPIAERRCRALVVIPPEHRPPEGAPIPEALDALTCARSSPRE